MKDKSQNKERDIYIVLALESTTKVLASTKGINEILPGNDYEFIFDETTLNCFSIGEGTNLKIL